MATSNAAASNGSKIIKFEDGIPITVILDGKRGIAGESTVNNWGQEEWKHWVNGDANLMYLPAAAQKQLELSGAQFRDWVTIEKVRGGKTSIWRVTVEEPHSDRAELGRVNYLRQKEVSPIRRTLTGSETPAERQQAELASYIANNGNSLPAAPRPAQQPAPIAPAATQIPISAAAVLMDMSRPEAKAMASALFNAIDAVAIAQSYARQKDLGITFTSEDVRAFAISAYINASKGGRA